MLNNIGNGTTLELIYSYLLYNSHFAAGYGSYGAANINLNFNTPDLTNVKANLSEGAARLSGKVCC